MFSNFKYLIHGGFKKAYGLVLIFSFYIGLNAQESRIDSLIKAFNSATEDSIRYDNLLDQIGFYRLSDNTKAGEKVKELNVMRKKINKNIFGGWHFS